MRRIPNLMAACLALALGLAACGGGNDNASDTSAGTSAGGAGTAEIVIESFTFKPDSVTVSAGTTVTWTNKDAFAHTIKPSDDLFPVSPDINEGDSFSHTYDTAGTYPYICGIHNSMTGTVVVT